MAGIQIQIIFKGHFIQIFEYLCSPLLSGNNWFEVISVIQSCCNISVILSTKSIPEHVVISCFPYKFPDNLVSSFL